MELAVDITGAGPGQLGINLSAPPGSGTDCHAKEVRIHLSFITSFLYYILAFSVLFIVVNVTIIIHKSAKLLSFIAYTIYYHSIQSIHLFR